MISRMMKMLQKEFYYFTGFSFSTRLHLACLFFLTIIITTGTTTITTASSVPRARGIAAISLTSQSEFSDDHDDSAAFKEWQQKAEMKMTAKQQPDKVKCKTEQGKDVDWFIAYKLPKIRTSSNALVRTGLAYAYILPSEEAQPSSSQKVDGEQQRSNVDVSVKNTAGHKGSFSGGRDKLVNSNVTMGLEKEDGDFSRAAGLVGKNTKKTVSTWILSSRGIDSPESMVGQTLGKLYVKDNQDVAFLTYNDQPPVGPTVFSGGHTKGVIVTSLASGGIWIQHSVPHFPLIDPNNYHYQYPRTGKINGQVFHCISFSSTNDVDDLAKILEITKPHVVNFSFPTDSFKNAFPQLISIVNRSKHLETQQNKQLYNLTIDINWSQSRSVPSVDKGDGNGVYDGVQANNAAEVSQFPCTNEIDERACLNGILMSDKTPIKSSKEEVNNASQENKNWDLMEIRSAGGVVLKAFVKGPSFNEDIYSSWIAPTYKTKLNVQSWLNGPHPFISNCSVSQYSVYNILNKNIAGQSFSTHNDHSKWAMSVSDEQPLVCISDLNRMEHQLKRGGVAVCFTDVDVWMTFNTSIIDVQPCPRLPRESLITNTTAVNNGTGDTLLSQSVVPFSSLLSRPSTITTPTISLSLSSLNSNVAHVVHVFEDDNKPKRFRSGAPRKDMHKQHLMHQRMVNSWTYHLK